MSFKRYSPLRKRGDKAIVTITRNRLQLNKECQRYFKNAFFAELYYDQEKKIIGIKPQEGETNDSLRINRYDDRGIAVIAAIHFIRIFKIEPIVDFNVRNSEGRKTGERSIQFIAKWHDKDKMVIVKLI